MRRTSWKRLALPLLLSASVPLALAGASNAAGTLPQAPDPVDGRDVAPAATMATDDDKPDIMLASYSGGHTIDKELREPEPRADGYFHVDTEATIAELKKLNVNTFYFLMWHSPTDWQDFTEEFLPAAQEAGIDVWAYIVPPSECHTNGWCSLPFKTDYITWAEEIATLSVEYDHLKGWVIDDFLNGSNSAKFTPEYMDEMTQAADAINPDLQLETVVYWKNAVKPQFYEQYAQYIDAVVFPYRDEPNHNHRRAVTLSQQLDEVLVHTDEYDLDLTLLIYTGRLGKFANPKPDYVRDALTTGLEYAEQGKIQGIVSYGTPHDGAPAVSSENAAMYGTGRLALFGFAGAPATGDYASASQTVTVDPDAERYTLNFWNSHRFFGKESTGERFLDVLVNDEVIWSADIVKGNNTDKAGRWRSSEGPLEIDPAIFEGKTTATLTFRLRQAEPASVHTETSVDNIQASGFEVINPGFEDPEGWEMDWTHNALIPEVDIWHADGPTRVFNVVAEKFGAYAGDDGDDDSGTDSDGAADSSTGDDGQADAADDSDAAADPGDGSSTDEADVASDGDSDTSAADSDADGGTDPADDGTQAQAADVADSDATGSDESAAATEGSGAGGGGVDVAGAGQDPGGLPVTGSSLLGLGLVALIAAAVGGGILLHRRGVGSH